MKILVLGSGGREHALVWHLKKSAVEVECAPGSDAIAKDVPVWNFKDFNDLANQVKAKKFSEVIVGPEKYLAEGVADILEAQGIKVFGPSKMATQLESSKAWAKDFCLRHQVPTARAEIFTKSTDIPQALKNFRAPFVVKASGLAASKGVWIGDNIQEAAAFATESLKHHDAVVAEEFLAGEEISFFVMIDGERHLFLGAAQDHKRLLENDLGPNTGGMGAYSPVPLLTKDLQKKIEDQVVLKILEGLNREKIYYRGFLFIGLMIVNGEPLVLEFNCRMGDPETQALMMRLQSPLVDLITGLRIGEPDDAQHLKGVSLNVVVAAKGYPEKPNTGFNLSTLESSSPEMKIFHSGTKWNGTTWTATGGRLFSVATLMPTLFECQSLVYPFIESLTFSDQIIYRRDIGVKAYRHLFTYGSKEFANA